MTPPEQSAEGIQAVFSLRYQVFCVERGFLPQEDFPDQQETDSYDRTAVHFAAIDPDGQAVGSVRLIHHVDGEGYPFQSHCPELWPEHRDVITNGAVEISRLVVSKHLLRQRGNEAGSPFASSELTKLLPCKRRVTPGEQIVLGLYRAIWHYCKQNNVTHWYAAMERSLARLLGRYGFNFREIGPEVDYYGKVSPFIADIAEIEDTVRSEYKALARWFEFGDVTRVGHLRILPVDMHSTEM